MKYNKEEVKEEIFNIFWITAIAISIESIIRKYFSYYKDIVVMLYILGIIIYFLYTLFRLFKYFKSQDQMQKYMTKNYLIASALAIIIVTISAIPSKNNSYTECGVGSVYTKYYDEYSDRYSEGCDLTTAGFFKLLAIFGVTFYISLLLLERKEKLEEKPKNEFQQEITEVNEGTELSGVERMKELKEGMIDDIVASDEKLRFFENYHDFIQVFKNDLDDLYEYENYSTVVIERHEKFYNIVILKEDTSFIAYSEYATLDDFLPNDTQEEDEKTINLKSWNIPYKHTLT